MHTSNKPQKTTNGIRLDRIDETSKTIFWKCSTLYYVKFEISGFRTETTCTPPPQTELRCGPLGPWFRHTVPCTVANWHGDGGSAIEQTLGVLLVYYYTFIRKFGAADDLNFNFINRFFNHVFQSGLRHFSFSLGIHKIWQGFKEGHTQRVGGKFLIFIKP